MRKNRGRIIFILAVVGIAIVYAYPPREKINLGLDLRGGMHLVLKVDTSKIEDSRDRNRAVLKALEIIRNRIDEFGVAEPVIQRQGREKIIVELPGIKEFRRARKLLGRTAALEFKLVDGKGELAKTLKGEIPPGDEILYDKKKNPYLLKEEILLTGGVLKKAQVGFDEWGSFAVNFELNPEGAKQFAEITGTHIGERLAIILDGVVQSAPNIKAKIYSRGQITGRFGQEEAADLALVLRTGALPAPIEIIEERTVGPSLGQDSVREGIVAGITGLIIVMLFMLAYYLLSGFLANFALLLNIVIILGVLSALKATLTLPGIAGIILTMGMAVDANVIIFERIREELAQGKTVRAAIDSGYRKAFRTILDANVTTLITAIILYQFGSGPIKGFAVTLSIGILASMFTSIVVTRTIFNLITGRRKIIKLSI
jgi:protein-export membrane protein SecD